MSAALAPVIHCLPLNTDSDDFTTPAPIMHCTVCDIPYSSAVPRVEREVQADKSSRLLASSGIPLRGTAGMCWVCTRLTHSLRKEAEAGASADVDQDFC